MTFCCNYCKNYFGSEADLNRHRAAPNGRCHQIHQRKIQDHIQHLTVYDPNDPEDIPCDDEPEGGYQEVPDGEMLYSDFDDVMPDIPSPRQSPGLSPGLSNNTDIAINQIDGEGERIPEKEGERSIFTGSQIKKCKRHIKYHEKRSAVLGKGKTKFETRREEELTAGLSPYRGFENADAFEHAEWAMSANLSQKSESNLLKTRLVSV